MLSVNPAFRRVGIGRHLVALAVDSIRAAGCLEVRARHALRLVCRASCTTHLTSHVIRHTSRIMQRTSHVTRHTSHVTRHATHVTRHTSRIMQRTSHATHHATCFQVVLEAEASNTKAIALYESLGFFRDKRLEKYYLNGGDAYRLKKWFPDLDYSAMYT
jgi:ribosomal protein S18 acetylase RimI-like enzyme